MEARSVLCILFVLLFGASIEGLNQRQNLPKRLFVFGDSDVDTGNIMKPLASSWVYPAGITFPGKPAGRFSDGRVLTDFIAEHLGIPSPVPYTARRFAGSKAQYGMNFASGGAGLFDTHFAMPNFTTQISHLEQLVKDGTYTRQQLSSSMVLFSSGGNDYSDYLLKNGTAEGVKAFTKTVINQIVVDLRRIISMGVGRIAITGLQPGGCMPIMTTFTLYASCIDAMNEQSIYHNSMLHEAVDGINNAHPDGSVLIVVLPMYDALMSILKDHDKLGQRFDDPLRQCCLGVNGGDCGSIDEHGKPLYKLCANPRRALFWDRVHPTQAGWSALIEHLFPTMDQLFS